MALPTYTMNLVKLPKQLCVEINNVLSNYWWQSNDTSSGMHWFSWDRLSLPKKEGGLGFKDLEKFNIAMLGKQTWRIMENPNSLMVRLLKGRYFRHTNILNAVESKKSSFIWKSILQGRDLVKQGLIYSIGDGTSVSAWLDPWLPTNPPRAPRTKAPVFNHCYVNELFNESSTDWDSGKIRALVDERDVPLILSLKLSTRRHKDVVGWRYNRSGFYSVKSGYWLATHNNGGVQIVPPPGDVNIKKRVWKLKTASKLKHFLWKMISESLPLGNNLRRRHVTNYSICYHGCSEEESINHLFFNCPSAQTIWRASGMPTTILFDTARPWEEKVNAILDFNLNVNVNTRSQQLPLWILWRLWKCRNTLVFQRRLIPWQVVLKQAQKDAYEWVNAGNYQSPSENQSRNNNTSVPTRWEKPEQGWYKCNYDGTFVTHIPSKVGWLIRDQDGNYRGGGQVVGRIVYSSLQSELQALLIAMQNAWIKGFKDVIFEGDNQDVINLLNGSVTDFENLNWLREIKLWREKFRQVRFTWTRRNYNKAAHILATTYNRSSYLFSFHLQTPSVIISTIVKDLN